MGKFAARMSPYPVIMDTNYKLKLFIFRRSDNFTINHQLFPGLRMHNFGSWQIRAQFVEEGISICQICSTLEVWANGGYFREPRLRALDGELSIGWLIRRWAARATYSVPLSHPFLSQAPYVHKVVGWLEPIRVSLILDKPVLWDEMTRQNAQKYRNFSQPNVV